MSERHAVYANTDAGTFRVGQPVDWDTAQARWSRLDDRRIAGRKPRVRHDGKRYIVNSFEVRSVDTFGRGLGSERHTLAFPVPYRLCRQSA